VCRRWQRARDRLSMSGRKALPAEPHPAQALTVVAWGRYTGNQKLLHRAIWSWRLTGSGDAIQEVERAAAEKGTVKVTVWRGNSEQTLDVDTVQLLELTSKGWLSGWRHLTGTHRAMSATAWNPPCRCVCGLLLYDLLPPVMVCTPASHRGVDGTPTPDLDAFLKAVTGRPDRASVRLRRYLNNALK